ncbi:MOSC domain-containing protein [Stutzerimonas stutzeri]|uniref:MOSC domain-containing protein n=1 Tax=Stutzerimonas stutzeri TaxID=316 RepID=UPI001C2EF7D6|nr:MOSC domain-containing protein [Stutzerimonas stutzeri]
MPDHTNRQWPVEGPFLRERLSRLPGVEKLTGIDKQLAPMPVWLDREGLRGDQVGDRRFHGGPDRSLCHYPAGHYAHWRRLYPHLRISPGAFGENLSTQGLDERQICIGDRFRWGEALIEVSQPRSPCINLDRRHDARGLARQLANSGRTGWLYRTLEPGEIALNAPLCLVDRPHPGISVARLWHSFLDDTTSDDELAQFAELEPLALEYRKRFRQRLDSRRRQQDQQSLF